MNFKAFLWDADGVLTVPEEYYSIQFAKKLGLDPDVFTPFFTDDFPKAIVGQADLKQLIWKNRDLWQIHTKSEINPLLQDWFTKEHIINTEAVALLKKMQSNGVVTALAINQERYRGNYMKTEMFPYMDHFFVSAEVGTKKPNPGFFEHCWNTLVASIHVDQRSEVLFIDDTPSHVEAARKYGFTAHYFQNTPELKKFLY